MVSLLILSISINIFLIAKNKRLKDEYIYFINSLKREIKQKEEMLLALTKDNDNINLNNIGEV